MAVFLLHFISYNRTIASSDYMNLLSQLRVNVGILLISFLNSVKYVPLTDPKTRSSASITIPTKRSSSGYHDCHALHEAFTKNLMWI